MKHFAANAITLVIVIGIAIAGAALFAIQSVSNPGPSSTPVKVVLERGDSLVKVSEALAEAGVVRSASIFRVAARYKGVASQLKFGEYEIPAGASMEEILDIVVSGQSLQYRITVAEGLTSWQVVELLKRNDILTGEIDELPPEGWLAPDTYFIDRGATRQEILARMQAAQARIINAAWEARQPDLPIESPKEALTLASIVEKETGADGERALVAGVFVNRLRKGMRLQSDPTIIYGITEGKGPLGRGILRSEINKPTPYNTYVIDRLPPGPIANPGKAAIEAVLNPAETDAIYFVADGTGGHAFAKTLREHQRNVAAWRKIERERQSQ